MKDKKRQARIQVFQEINSFMELNLEKWNGIDEIRRTYDVFINNLKKIKELEPEHKQDISGLSEEISAKRRLILQKIFPAGNILEVYSQDHPIGKNSELLLIGQRNVESLKDKALLNYSISLHKRCDRLLMQAVGNESLDQISPDRDIKRYGLTRLMLDEMYTLNQQFQSTLKLKEDVNTYRKKSRKKLDGLILANRDLLEKRLNKLMSVFAGTHPSFYREYKKISGKN